MSKLTDEQIQAMYDECDKKSDGGNEFMLMFARAIESAATEPLLQREAELMKENARLHRQNTVLLDEKLKAESEAKELFNVFMKRDKNIAELERQLVEALKDAEPVRRMKQRADELIAAFENAPDGKALDMQKGQS